MVRLDPQVIASRRRVPQIVRARLIVAHAARDLGLTDSDVADVLGISRQAVSLMMRRRCSAGEREEVCRRIAREIRVPGR
jgi:predicted transcriptional regulator